MRLVYVFLVCVIFGMASNVPARAAANDDAAGFITDIANKALVIIQNKTLDKEKKQRAIQNLFITHVDIAWVGKFVMGRFWRQATDTQKKDYIDTYQDFITRHYASRFSEYSGGDFKITSSKPAEADEYVVSMAVNSEDKSNEPVIIDYKVRGKKGSFKVFDIIVEGVSMITTQRSEFASVLNQKGIDGLIEQLKNKSLPVKQ